MRRFQTIPALVVVALLAAVFLLTPQSWVNAATGRLADLRASTRALTSAIIAQDVALVDAAGAHVVPASESTAAGIFFNTASLLNLAPAFDTSLSISLSAGAQTTELIPVAASEVIDGKVTLATNGTVTVTGEYGTGTTCNTDTVNIFTVDMTTAEKPYYVQEFHIPAGKAFCITQAQAIAVKGGVVYAQYAP